MFESASGSSMRSLWSRSGEWSETSGRLTGKGEPQLLGASGQRASDPTYNSSPLLISCYCTPLTIKKVRLPRHTTELNML